MNELAPNTGGSSADDAVSATPNAAAAEPAKAAPSSAPAGAGKAATPAAPLHCAYGVPDEVVASLGPAPAAGETGAKGFFALLQQFARDCPPASFTDWCDLWDMASDRYDLTIIRRTKRVLPPLFRDRAIHEITRPGEQRFRPVDLNKLIDRTDSFPLNKVNDSAQNIDPEAAKETLKALDLPASGINDLAFILAQDQMLPLEALADAKVKAYRAAAHELERRRDRREARSGPGANLPVQDAEFAEAEPRSQAVRVDETPTD